MADTPNKTKLYVAVGFGVLVLILIVVVVIVSMNGGDATVPAGGVAAAAIAAAEAARRHRNDVAAKVAETKAGLEGVAEDLKVNKDEADKAMAAVDDAVTTTNRDDKETEGEDAFKPGSV